MKTELRNSRRLALVVGQVSAVLLFLLPMLVGACRGGKTLHADDVGDTIAMRYAENIVIVKYADYVLVTLRNPWHAGRELHRFVLVSDEKPLQSVSCPEATVVHVPLRRSVVFNAAHASLVGMLGATDQIVGVADLKYMQLPEIHRRVSEMDEPLIYDCGNSMSPDVERIVDLRADAILLSPFENSGGYGRLEKIGIPIIECAEYMETSALGRAEWMVFYGLLYGKYHEACRLFNEVEQRYLTLSEQARKAWPRRSVITEKLTGSTWYVAGGRSSVGRLLADAGGDYAWADDDHSGSLALPFEEVLDRAGESDVWVFNDVSREPPTYARLSAEYHGYSQLRAYREHHVWFFNSLSVPYFEEVSFRPDYLLGDYVRILHPELNLSGEPRYFRKVRK